MSNTQQARIDEVSKYYDNAKSMENFENVLFYLTAGVSIILPYAKDKNLLQAVFILLVIAYYLVSLVLKVFLTPKAERVRRQQLLSDAFKIPLIQEKTSLYYNNQCPPSVMRLGVNVMENAFFSKEIASKMLVKSRAITSFYVAGWILIFTLRHNHIEWLSLLTQIVFSQQVITKWFNLEWLKWNQSQIYERFYSHFLHKVGVDSKNAIATILDNVISYEANKTSAGVLLSSKVFQKHNPSLTIKWNQICQELNLGECNTESPEN